MLTSDHAIVECRQGRAIPDRLGRESHRHYLNYAERMLALYRDGMGRQRRELHREVEAILADEPECPVRRVQSFCKLLDDASEFHTDPQGESARLRLALFEAVAAYHSMVERCDRLFEHDQEKVKTRISEKLDQSWNDIEMQLYADVPATSV
jgi:predicted nuclease of restriction endonuclease-like RecB superfamily